MIGLTIKDLAPLMSFWAIFCRSLPIIIQFPLFDQMTMPATVKVLFSLMIAYLFFPHVYPHMQNNMQGITEAQFIYVIIFNLIVGLILGLFIKAIIFLFSSAGGLITQQIGFSAIRYFDPSTMSRIGPFEKLINLTLVVLILKSGALLPMFKGLFMSFESIHFGDMGAFGASGAFYMRLFKELFKASVLLASPLIITNLIIMLVLGIIARTVPQMNILMVSFVVNIGVGLLVFSGMADEFFQRSYQIYIDRLSDWYLYLK